MSKNAFVANEILNAVYDYDNRRKRPLQMSRLLDEVSVIRPMFGRDKMEDVMLLTLQLSSVEAGDDVIRGAAQELAKKSGLPESAAVQLSLDLKRHISRRARELESPQSITDVALEAAAAIDYVGVLSGASSDSKLSEFSEKLGNDSGLNAAGREAAVRLLQNLLSPSPVLSVEVLSAAQEIISNVTRKLSEHPALSESEIEAWRVLNGEVIVSTQNGDVAIDLEHAAEQSVPDVF